jgi:ankyrin repeat protein
LAPSAPKSFASSQARTASAQRQFSAAAPRTADAASKAASNSASNTATAAASAAGGAAALGGVLTESPTPLPGSVASLWSAIAAGDSRRTELLLDQGADTRGLDPLGRTPLSLAVIRQRADLVRLLLAHGADPNARDQSGDTPLERARQEGRADILAMLQAAGAH